MGWISGFCSEIPWLCLLLLSKTRVLSADCWSWTRILSAFHSKSHQNYSHSSIRFSCWSLSQDLAMLFLSYRKRYFVTIKTFWPFRALTCKTLYFALTLVTASLIGYFRPLSKINLFPFLDTRAWESQTAPRWIFRSGLSIAAGCQVPYRR